MTAALSASGLPARRLVVEITESAVIANANTSVAVLTHLRQLALCTTANMPGIPQRRARVGGAVVEV